MKNIVDALETEDKNLFIKRMRIALYYMAIPLVISFAGVDYCFQPNKLTTFIWPRLLVVPISVSLYQLYKIKWIVEKYYQLPAHLFVIYLGGLNTYLAWQTGAEASPYYAGLNLVGIAAFGFLPWNRKHMLVTAGLLYGPYFAVAILKGHNLDLTYFIPHTAFMISTIFISGIVTHLSYQLRKAELDSRLSLNKQITIQEHIIRDKTQEGIYLEKLMTQFSPQVIEAIKSGEISIEKKQRRDLTCIFVDVENSTARSARIDHADYTETLCDFFSSCIDIFLKHNVTVGTYLGDGILAFVNAPKPSDKHQLIALESALEILEQNQSKKNYYREKWRTEFTIRIGINTGFASVGFFPNYTKGTYTAVGEPVNLASRLCAKAKPNSICVTKTLLKHVGEYLQNAVVEFQEINDRIKGFEKEPFELYTITPEFKKIDNATETCPLCGSVLTIRADLGKSFLLKCSKCNYSDITDDKAIFEKIKSTA